MTKIKMIMLLAVVALALASALPALAQDTTQPSTQAYPSTGQQPPDQNGSQPMQQPEMNQAPTQPNQGTGSAVSGTNAQTSQDSQTLSGTISADGKTLNSNGTTYTISNPNSVQAYANRPITVGYEMGSNNSIRITKVMLTKPQQ